MYSCTKTCTLTGLNGYPVDVEVDLSNGMPKIILVGLADTAVKESTERVKSAIKNSGFDFPKKRITINLAPANLRKDGTQLDLAIAVSLLSCDESLELDYSPYTYMGELALDEKLIKFKELFLWLYLCVKKAIENLLCLMKIARNVPLLAM